MISYDFICFFCNLCFFIRFVLYTIFYMCFIWCLYDLLYFCLYIYIYIYIYMYIYIYNVLLCLICFLYIRFLYVVLYVFYMILIRFLYGLYMCFIWCLYDRCQEARNGTWCKHHFDWVLAECLLRIQVEPRGHPGSTASRGGQQPTSARIPMK